MGSATVSMRDGAIPVTLEASVITASSLRTKTSKSGLTATPEAKAKPRCWKNTTTSFGLTGGSTQCAAVRKVWQPISVPVQMPPMSSRIMKPTDSVLARR